MSGVRLFLGGLATLGGLACLATPFAGEAQPAPMFCFGVVMTMMGVALAWPGSWPWLVERAGGIIGAPPNSIGVRRARSFGGGMSLFATGVGFSLVVWAVDAAVAGDPLDSVVTLLVLGLVIGAAGISGYREMTPEEIAAEEEEDAELARMDQAIEAGESDGEEGWVRWYRRIVFLSVPGLFVYLLGLSLLLQEDDGTFDTDAFNQLAWPVIAAVVLFGAVGGLVQLALASRRVMEAPPPELTEEERESLQAQGIDPEFERRRLRGYLPGYVRETTALVVLSLASGTAFIFEAYTLGWALVGVTAVILAWSIHRLRSTWFQD